MEKVVSAPGTFVPFNHAQNLEGLCQKTFTLFSCLKLRGEKVLDYLILKQYQCTALGFKEFNNERGQNPEN